MKRVILLGALIAVGGLSLVVSGQAPAVRESIRRRRSKRLRTTCTSSPARAPRTRRPSAAATRRVITDGGVTLVDAKLPGFGPTISTGEERHEQADHAIINTHTHSDHTGSNEFFGATIETIVQENTKATWRTWTSSRARRRSSCRRRRTRTR